MNYISPLRYPGGKSVLSNFIKLLVRENKLLDGVYVEPFAGGAGVALSLLFNEYMSRIIINDLNPSIYAFWYSVLNYTQDLCDLIESTEVTIEEWQNQKMIQLNENATILELGFSTFFLNRTNRSGIINGGVIGGIEQQGKWKIDARYNKKDLISRIRRIARYKDRISLYNYDALKLIQEEVPNLPEKTLVYLDPPYYKKGQDLYQNHLNHDDHEKLAEFMKNNCDKYWLITYDNIGSIKEMYKEMRQMIYSLNYSAANRYAGSEIMIFSDSLNIPNVDNPTKVKI
ncbi:MAG: DNA methyltransferase [Cohnella sp.]|uniref:DNA adenine methylase n=1 Tax=Cohnella sp. TaxID=1883426 RepID=UPI000E37E107|nr:DNA adenine methylase [Cohnella sp.]REK65686.1 MAG: DNA methyltransferase [Cohnella sp.]